MKDFKVDFPVLAIILAIIAIIICQYKTEKMPKTNATQEHPKQFFFGDLPEEIQNNAKIDFIKADSLQLENLRNLTLDTEKNIQLFKSNKPIDATYEIIDDSTIIWKLDSFNYYSTNNYFTLKQK